MKSRLETTPVERPNDPELATIMATCEEMGEVQVREHLARGLWNDRRQKIARYWLGLQEQSREAKAHRETMSLNLFNSVGTWVAAIGSAIAAIFSILAYLGQS
jgi:hypothetical protein